MMKVSSFKKYLDAVVNIAVVICIIALIAFFGHQWFFPQAQQSSYKEDFAEGKVLAEVPNLSEGNLLQS
ncbi:MAG: hypothetical protein H0W58_17580 [Acidobacteria bacterium]|nr:hypothetical protein [Acidobacteriota bacterium]